MQSTFSTPRLSLKLITEEDCEFVAQLVNTKGWMEFIGDRNIHSKEDAIKYISKIKNTPDLYYWVVKIKQLNTPIGIISLLKRSYLEYFDIGFAFLPEFNGHGYAFEAAKKVYTYLSKEPAYQTILATTIVKNTRSINLLTKLGLQFEKEVRIQDTLILVYSSSTKI